MIGVLKYLYLLLTISTGYVVGLAICFLLIDFFFVLFAKRRAYVDFLFRRVKRVGLLRLLVGITLSVLIFANYFTQYSFTTHYWLPVVVYSFLVRVTFLGFRGAGFLVHDDSDIDMKQL